LTEKLTFTKKIRLSKYKMNPGKIMFSKNSAFVMLLMFCGILLFTNTSKCQDDSYLPFAQVMPAPVGGMESVYKHIAYPELAKKAGVSGKVYALVYVNENGGIDQVKVIRGIGAGCDEAAIDGVKATKFSPGKNNGAPAKVKLSLAIIFKLD
jgi:protein TonB